jgi:hypothetical protein
MYNNGHRIFDVSVAGSFLPRHACDGSWFASDRMGRPEKLADTLTVRLFPFESI